MAGVPPALNGKLIETCSSDYTHKVVVRASLLAEGAPPFGRHALHPQGECSSYVVETGDDKQRQEARKNPFAVLEQLKRKGQ